MAKMRRPATVVRSGRGRRVKALAQAAHPKRQHAQWGRKLLCLEPNPDTAPVVAWIFQMRLDGHTLARITRALNDAAKLPFIEVHVATSVEECEKRDPKGLYARARRGELKGLTGVDAPYEPPENADLVLDTTNADIDELVAQVLELLNERSPRSQ